MDKKTLEIQIKLLANQALSQVKEFSSDIKNAADKAKGFTVDAKSSLVMSIRNSMKEASMITCNLVKYHCNQTLMKYCIIITLLRMLLLSLASNI